MSTRDHDRLERVLAYHDRSKHRVDRSAASLGYMDWTNQPDPFRRFAPAERTDLEHPPLRDLPWYDSLFQSPPAAASIGRSSISRLFYHSLALSAWKQVAGADPWSLRVNPSSGALHPTEGYLIHGAIRDFTDEPGVFHYAPFHHALERRCLLTEENWSRLTESLPCPCLLVGLTSIYWRESWKYGERAFRYCHHDVGHAIGAIAFAARTLGWEASLLHAMEDGDMSQLLGVHLQQGIEAEHADCLLALHPAGATGGAADRGICFTDGLRASLARREFFGEPNSLSPRHHAWPVIDEVAEASRVDRVSSWRTDVAAGSPLQAGPRALDEDRRCSAEQIIRQRRSAIDMDGHTSLSRSAFYRVLSRSVPRPGQFPFSVLPWQPRISLILFVHRVDGLAPGIYVLARHAAHEASLRKALKESFAWDRPAECPEGLGLYLLAAGDARRAARALSCGQDIAADGVCCFGMLAEFEPALQQCGPAFYPRLFWETGLIGQVLYLEAEAAGVRGTGIGCFLDDAVHDMLGVRGRVWQSLYHFTIGGPMEDPRVTTIPPYAHLRESAGA